MHSPGLIRFLLRAIAKRGPTLRSIMNFSLFNVRIVEDFVIEKDRQDVL